MILVTGGCGFIGRFLVRELLKTHKPEDIKVIDKIGDENLKKEMSNVKFYKFDMSNRLGKVFLENILKEEDVDTVYHLAGLLGTSELFPRIIEAERVNVLGLLNLLEVMRKYDVKKIIFPSKPNIWKHNVYTITKEHCERYLQMYNEVYGFRPVILCPFNVYGPEEEIEQYRKAVPYFIISALKNEPIEIFGNGEQTMDLVFVEDCAKAMVLSSKVKTISKIDIGSGIETKVIDLAKLIIKLTNSKSKIKHLSMRKGEIPNARLCADMTRMKTLLNYTPETTLEDGLKKTIEHYKNNLDKYKVYEFKKEELE